MSAAHSDMWISLETGAARGTVRRRREALGIVSQPGRRRGVTVKVLPSVRQRGDLDSTETQMIARYRLDRDRRTPATDTTLARRIMVLAEVPASEPYAYDDALLDVASAAALIHHHRSKLRRAA